MRASSQMIKVVTISNSAFLPPLSILQNLQKILQLKLKASQPANELFIPTGSRRDAILTIIKHVPSTSSSVHSTHVTSSQMSQINKKLILRTFLKHFF